MKRYFIRVLKSILFFFGFGFLVVVMAFVLGNSSENPITFEELLQRMNLTPLIIFGVVFGAAYPLLGYVKRKVYTNHSLDEEKQEVIRLFADVHFELVSDEDKKIIFRHKNPVARFMRLYEGHIEVDYSEDTVIVSGLRRDVDRLARRMQQLLQKEAE
jgi:tryptophan-rich sensory protein